MSINKEDSSNMEHGNRGSGSGSSSSKNTRRYNVLPRSLLDPKINDPDAPTHVFHEVNSKKKEKEKDTNTSFSGKKQDNAGQAVMYNIHFDDSEYDYMQHLMPTGNDPNEIYIPSSASKAKTQKKKNGGDLANAIQEEEELPWNQVVQNHAQYYERGLQPDMDPEMREIYEALADDDVIETADMDGLDKNEDEEEDFFSSILRKGAKKKGSTSNKRVEDGDDVKDTKPEIGQGWLDEMEKYKMEPTGERQNEGYGSDNESEEYDNNSEARDTIGDLESVGGNARRQRVKRRLPSEVGSGISMSSSTMYRNDILKTLDERFEVIQAEYATSEEEDDENEEEMDDDFDDEEIEDPNEAREDFNEIMDDFLSKFTVLGNKVAPTNGEGPLDVLDSFRQALKVDRVDDMSVRRKSNKNEESWPERPVPKVRERWDCESVLSTYSNQANHPRMLRLQETLDTRGPKFKIDPRRGIGLSVEEDKKAKKNEEKIAQEEDENMPSSSHGKTPVTRMRGETTEERKARKKEGKAERQRRRVEKKDRREAFGREQARLGGTEQSNISIIV